MQGRKENPRFREPSMDDARRTAVLVALAVSLLATVGSSLALLPLPHSVPLAGALAVVATLALLPTTILWTLRRRQAVQRSSVLLLLASAASFGSYLVGGAVGPSTPVMFLPAILALAIFLTVGHPSRETAEGRHRRVLRWSRRSFLVGGASLFLALVLYFVYASLPAVAPLTHTTLTESSSLSPGEVLQESVLASAGEQVYALVATNVTGQDLTAMLLSPTNSTLGSAAPGTVANPQSFYVAVQDHPGVYHLTVRYAGSGPIAAVNWTLATVPAGGVALAAFTVSLGALSVPLMAGGAILWYWEGRRRRPRSPLPSASPPGASDSGTGGVSAPPVEGDPPAGA